MEFSLSTRGVRQLFFVFKPYKQKRRARSNWARLFVTDVTVVTEAKFA